ncbi:hypothetical protein PEC18_37245 [Paucibacter sp. O1-1]|nr:hypothetical protein [Paucibacter sp. O1-1]MDA3831296.1 hypothetical protein [Paucibacter sp. O1-1]
MTETANILHNATANSLVLMDEIGRGTSTYDGLSLAWSAAEYLAKQVSALTLFATHYFELTQLPEILPAVVNVHLDAIEHDDTIAFMHAVQEGAASKSYGLQVAALAGVPNQVIKAAKYKLHQLENRDITAAEQVPSQVSMNLLAPMPEPSPAMDKLAQINPDDFTPSRHWTYCMS